MWKKILINKLRASWHDVKKERAYCVCVFVDFFFRFFRGGRRMNSKFFHPSRLSSPHKPKTFFFVFYFAKPTRKNNKQRERKTPTCFTLMLLPSEIKIQTPSLRWFEEHFYGRARRRQLTPALINFRRGKRRFESVQKVMEGRARHWLRWWMILEIWSDSFVLLPFAQVRFT